MNRNEENPDPLPKIPLVLIARYEAEIASMDTPEGRAAAKSAFDAGPEVFQRKPLNSARVTPKSEQDT
jgi:hypothetical protein